MSRPVFGVTPPAGHRLDYVEPPSTWEPHSQAAAEAIKPSAGSLRAAVFDVVQRCGAVAEWRIEDELGLAGNTVRPRLWELEKAGLIEKHGEVIKPTTGRMTTLYRVRGDTR